MRHKNFVHGVLSVEKTAGGNAMIGMSCMAYSSLGRTFIFNIVTLPSQEKEGMFHLCRSCLMEVRIGEEFSLYRSERQVGSRILK